MSQDDNAAAETLIDELVQWIRNEVAPVARSGANWKAIIKLNRRGSVIGALSQSGMVPRFYFWRFQWRMNLLARW